MSKQDGRGRQVTTEEVDDPAASILHVDLDAFFASVELLDRPELRERPVIVAHEGPRSVVTAANYVARRYAVNSAMPLAVALRRCPGAVVLAPHYERYERYSREVMDMLRDVTPLVEPLSVDEAFLDVAGARTLFGSPWRIATALRERVLAHTGLTISVGVASTKFVAKLASSRAKPDGLLVVPAADTLAFLHPLPISALWGVGASTEARLRSLGLSTIGDVAQTPLDVLVGWIGPAGGRKLHDLAHGRDPRPVTTTRFEKSIGNERTYGEDIVGEEAVHRELLRLSHRVGSRLRAAGLVGRTVSLKFRLPDFTTYTRSRTLAEPTDSAHRIYAEMRDLYAQLRGTTDRVRLLGVRAEQLSVAGGGAPALWDDDAAWRDAEQALDALAERFGAGAVRPAALLDPAAERPRRWIEDWHRG